MTTAVAIALYNGARFIEKQLDTIRNQTQKPDHVVLCDDGSKDGTVEIVRDYITRHGLGDSWELYVNERNLGYIQNFYKAMGCCGEDLIFLCDQDDIWCADKISKMTAIMEQRGEIMLLSCKYGIIDADDVEQHSLVERKPSEDESVKAIHVSDIMRAYHWPGMLMCVRNAFFKGLIDSIDGSKVAHDLILAVCAADKNGFYEYNYVGAYHRRHDNNTAREEHRISKLLNLEKKLKDIAITRELWRNLSETRLPIGEDSYRQIRERLGLLEERERALTERSMGDLLCIYKKDKGQYLRAASLACDIWLICFGDYKNKETSA